ncbi:hypothetical protein AB1Y20_000899 [Prymnesium parvum]|uniref:CBM20 domain-containing protein n=1 Tax=Prymnesium parvum TaxID=97485 RepID=A0AB34K9C0_PRYPA
MTNGILCSNPEHWKYSSISCAACRGCEHSRRDVAPSRSSHEQPVRVVFRAKVETHWGDTVMIVGSCPELGGWQPLRGVPMTTNCQCYPTWTASLTVSSACEYKFIILRAEVHGRRPVDWEPLGNRELSLKNRNGALTLNVTAEWGKAASMDWVHVPPVHWATPKRGGDFTARTPSFGVAMTGEAPALVERSIPYPSSCANATVDTNRISAPGASSPAPDGRAIVGFLPSSTNDDKSHGSACNPLIAEPSEGSPFLSKLLGSPLECIESCDGSWPPSESGSTRSAALSQPPSTHTSSIDLTNGQTSPLPTHFTYQQCPAFEASFMNCALRNLVRT